MPILDYNTAALNPTYRRIQFWCAVAVAVSVFPLIWMGGLVTSHGAGMSVPDWPNSYGYNMFLFPPSQWIGGIFYEHTHRLLGTLSGFLSIALVMITCGPSQNPRARRWIGFFTVAMFVLTLGGLGIKTYLLTTADTSDEYQQAFKSGISHFYVLFGSLGLVGLMAWLGRRRESRQWLCWLTIVQLLAIIIQGTLGGLRVTEVNTTLAIIHGCFAQAFFCLAAFTALATSKWWIHARHLDRALLGLSTRRATWLAGIALILLFCQLIVGATMRHHQAGLAIPDLPLAFGKVAPPLNESDLDRANALRIWTYNLPPATLVQMWLHYAHRVGAILVSSAIGILAFHVFRNLRQCRSITMLTVILCVLVVCQFMLGVLTVYWAKPADIASLHVATGALTLMTTALTLAVIARQCPQVASEAYETVGSTTAVMVTT